MHDKIIYEIMFLESYSTKTINYSFMKSIALLFYITLDIYEICLLYYERSGAIVV